MAGIFEDLALNPAERLFAEFVEGFIGQGLSANSIISKAQELGLGIRRTKALSLIRYANDAIASDNYVRGLGSDELIDTSQLQFYHSTLERNYRVILSARYYNPSTNRYELQHITVDTDVLTSKSEFLNTYDDIITATFLNYPIIREGGQFDPNSLMINKIWVNPSYSPSV